jgi:large subunit ribosomal protein L17
MRHQRAGLHLSRTSAHRRSLFSNLIASLFTYERIRTTDAKAKQTRRLAERTITLARRLGDVLTKAPDSRTPEERARMVHAYRMARRWVRDRGAVVKLFDEIGPRYLARPGGYTRIVKLGPRPGDAAPISILELIPDGQPSGGAERPAVDPEAQAGRGGQAKKTAGAGAKAAKPAKAAPARAAKGKGQGKEDEDEEGGTRGAAKARAKQATGPSSRSKAAKPKAKSKSPARPAGKSGKSKKK